MASSGDKPTAMATAGEEETFPPNCDIPFEQLAFRSQLCLTAPASATDRCETFVDSQFPEVLSLTVWPVGMEAYERCSGTLVSGRWVVTAAHCFDGFTASAIHSSAPLPGTRAYSPQPGVVRLRAHVADRLSEEEKEHIGIRVTISDDYRGAASTPPYANDIAVIELDAAYPIDRLAPAMLTGAAESGGRVTLAGYGLTDAEHSGSALNVTWTEIAKPGPGAQSRFVPRQSRRVDTGFCLGDSGGPVFAGRFRGCRTTDRGGEPHPRPLEGLISYLRPAVDLTGASATQIVAACAGAEWMSVQRFDEGPQRNLICRATRGEASGCP